MKIVYRLIILFAVVFSGCETVIENSDLEFVEKIVVQARLTAGEKIEYVSITKTLRADTYYTPESSYITDADVSIFCDGVEYKLHYSGKGNYACDLIPRPGKKYNLEINWNGKNAYAETFIPEDFNILSTFTQMEKINKYWDGEIEVYYAKVSPIAGSTFLSTYETDEYPGLRRYWNAKPKSSEEVSDDGTVHVKLTSYTSYMPGKILRGFVEAYDKKFAEIIKTIKNLNNDDDLFSTTGYLVRWNVKGDGIGMFIGLNKTEFEFSLD